MSCSFNIGNLRLSSGKIPNFAIFGDNGITTSCLISFKPIKLRRFRVCYSLPLNAKYFRENSAETKNHGPSRRQLIPNSSEVESLVREICDSTSIAEFELKREGFRLYVARDLNGISGNSPAPPDPITLNNALTNTNGSVTAPPSLAITKPESSSEDLQPSDESLVILRSPTVGLFRRSRTIKGKRVPPSCKEKQMVKEGQVLCYIEQLGCELPVECDVSGEVVKIMRQDGDTVGYKDALMAIRPALRG